MAWPVFAAACLLALAPRTLALRSRTLIAAEADILNHSILNHSLLNHSILNHSIPSRSIPNRSLFDTAYRHKMVNYWDLQYAAVYTLGNQTMRGVLDTGSFEMVVFSKNCSNCGEARAYNGSVSQDVHWGNRTRTQSYGSGSCTSVDATDKVVIGEAMIPAQDIWVAQDCEMPLLGGASFTAIVGIGPPGHLLTMANKKKAEHEKLQEKYKKDGLEVPYELKDMIERNEEDLVDAQFKVDLLSSLGTQTFSACYGRDAGAPGWIIWNDATREGLPGVRKIPVVGMITWGLKLGNVGLVDSAGKQMAMSCQDGCGAIMDTGTSLIGVPSIIYNRIMDALAPDDGESVDCTHLDKLPRLLLTLGDEKVYLPPSAYIGQVSGVLNREAVGFMRYTRETVAQRCTLLLMDLGNQKTQFGPMFIIGIPFMRQYYTTFDLGSGPGNRSILVSTASASCEAGATSNVEEFRREERPLMVDASKIRVPHWLKSGEHHEI